MIDCLQLRTYIIRPALDLVHMYSEGAEELLVATCAQESQGGKYLKQIGGPALGIYQMEPMTHDDIWHSELMDGTGELRTINSKGYVVLKACKYVVSPPADTMIHNLYYATIMARIFWLRFKEPMPSPNKFDDIWHLYKKYWNTEKGAATYQEFSDNYYKFTLDNDHFSSKHLFSWSPTA